MPEKPQSRNEKQDQAPSNGQEVKPAKSSRGFAAMDPQRQRDIASEGGRAAHEQGKAHKFTPEEAREAGRKGGMASGAARASRSKARAAAIQAGHEASATGKTAGQQSASFAGVRADAQGELATLEERAELEDAGRA